MILSFGGESTDNTKHISRRESGSHERSLLGMENGNRFLGNITQSRWSLSIPNFNGIIGATRSKYFTILTEAQGIYRCQLGSCSIFT